MLADHLPANTLPGLAQKIQLLREQLQQYSEHAASLGVLDFVIQLNDVHRMAAELQAEFPVRSEIDGELYYWAKSLAQQASALRDDLNVLLPDPEIFSQIPSLAELARESTPSSVVLARLKQIDHLIERCDELAQMDFDFLYDNVSGLLSIGFDVAERRRDPSCYDLLASEARLASFLLVARQQLPQKHWFSLGRLLTRHGRHVSLISWSGSMFEYLMPQLIMPCYHNTLLAQTCKAAVARQIEYGRQRAVPWGISESCYNATDMHHVYQYRAFGVPGLGLKRGLGEDLVIAPYASALALMVMPQDACRNLQIMAEKGFLGAYGFFEAIDYTPSRVPRGKDCAIVRAFMAHHQGMSLLALTYVLQQQPMQRRFMASPHGTGDRFTAAGARAETWSDLASPCGRSGRRSPSA